MTNLWAIPLIFLFVGLIGSNLVLEVVTRRRRAHRVDAYLADWGLPNRPGLRVIHGSRSTGVHVACATRVRREGGDRRHG